MAASDAPAQTMARPDAVLEFPRVRRTPTLRRAESECLVHPPEFRWRAVELSREGAKPFVQLAKDLGISESCLRNRRQQADVDEGRREGLTSSEKEERTRFRKENRVLRLERDILSRAAAFFAAENVLPITGGMARSQRARSAPWRQRRGVDRLKGA